MEKLYEGWVVTIIGQAWTVSTKKIPAEGRCLRVSYEEHERGSGIDCCIYLVMVIGKIDGWRSQSLAVIRILGLLRGQPMDLGLKLIMSTHI